MKNKAALAMMMAGSMMAPHSGNSPVNGQVEVQQMIEQETKKYSHFGQRKGRIKSNVKLGRPFIVRNQRQKRKRWRQCPQRRIKYAKSN